MIVARVLAWFVIAAVIITGWVLVLRAIEREVETREATVTSYGDRDATMEGEARP
jgi:hypothetical protein